MGKAPLPIRLQYKEHVPNKNICCAAYSYKGVTYVAYYRSVDKIIEADFTDEHFLTVGGVQSISIHNDIIYMLVGNGSDFRIDVYNIYGASLSSWRHEDRRAEESGSLTVVADKLVVADRLNQRLTVYSLNGDVIKNISVQEVSLGPVELCTLDNSSVILSCTDESTLLRINIDTEQVMWTSDCIEEPGGVVCYEEDYVLVSPYRSAQTVIYVLDINNG